MQCIKAEERIAYREELHRRLGPFEPINVARECGYSLGGGDGQRVFFDFESRTGRESNRGLLGATRSQSAESAADGSVKGMQRKQGERSVSLDGRALQTVTNNEEGSNTHTRRQSGSGGGSRSKKGSSATGLSSSRSGEHASRGKGVAQGRTSSRNGVSGSKENLQGVQKTLSGSQRTSSQNRGSKENLSGSKRSLSGSQGSLSESRKNLLSGSRGSLSGSKENLSASRGSLAGSRGSLSKSKGSLSGSKEGLATSNAENTGMVRATGLQKVSETRGRGRTQSSGITGTRSLPGSRPASKERLSTTASNRAADKGAAAKARTQSESRAGSSAKSSGESGSRSKSADSNANLKVKSSDLNRSRGSTSSLGGGDGSGGIIKSRGQSSKSSSAGKTGISTEDGEKSGSEESLYVYRGSVASEYDVPLAYLRSRSQSNEQKTEDDLLQDEHALTKELMSSAEGRAALADGKPLSKEARRKLRSEQATSRESLQEGRADAVSSISPSNQPMQNDVAFQSKNQAKTVRISNEQTKITEQKGKAEEKNGAIEEVQQETAVRLSKQIDEETGAVAQILVNGQPPQQTETQRENGKRQKG